MEKRSKIIIATTVVLTGLVIGGIWLKKQVSKILDYKLTFKNIKLISATPKRVSFNVFFDFLNKSDININLSEQVYDIYINDKLVNTLSNYSENILAKNSVSPIGFNVDLDFNEINKTIKMDYTKMLLNPKDVLIKIDMKWKAKLGFIKVPVGYVWETNLKEILGWYIPVYKKK